MNATSRGVLCGFGMVVLGCASALAMATQPVPAGPIPVKREAPAECVDAIYRFLPGEFNFCVAARDVYRGRYRSAVEMLQLAAGWGNKKAQYVLGLMYFKGEHVAADRPLGLAWLVLAAERHDPTYEAVLVSAYGKSTPAERHRAAVLLSSMRPVYTDAVAARRAQRRFDRAMRELGTFGPYPTTLCIAGFTGGNIDPSGASAMCPSISVAVTRLHQVGDAYFEGWEGHVTVGPLKPVEKTDARSGSDAANSPRQ